MISKGYSTITLEQFRQSTPDAWIAQSYLGVSKLPTLINSPIREDSSPSFSIYESDGIVKFIDFGTGDKGDIYTLLSLIWKVSRREAFERVLHDFKDSITTFKTGFKHIKRTAESSLNVITRGWNQDDLDYWESYGINKQWLEFGMIFPISRVLITKNGDTFGLPCDKLAYVYVENKDGKQSLKVYQPLNKQYKWMSKHDSSVWDLWEQLPLSGDRLIITSSRKDALCIWSNTGIPSISLQSEGAIPKIQVVNQLKERFKQVFVLYDNDFQSEVNHGRIYGKTIADQFNLIQLEIPTEYRSKDVSDLCKNWGRNTVYEVIHNLLKQH